MRKIAEVLRLHHERSCCQRDIALAVGVSPTTVGEYVRRAKSAGIGYPLPAGMDETALRPRRHNHDDAWFDLDMHHVAGGPVLDVLPQQTAPVERMPAIENLNFLPDMGRMTPTL